MQLTSSRSSEDRNRVVSGLSRAFTLILLIAAIACIPAAADPVVQITQCGTVISQPGHYIVANDLNCAAGPVAPTSSAANPLTAWVPLHNPLDGSTIVQPDPPSCSSGDGIDIISDHVDLGLDGHTITGCGGFIGIGVG